MNVFGPSVLIIFLLIVMFLLISYPKLRSFTFYKELLLENWSIKKTVRLSILLVVIFFIAFTTRGVNSGYHHSFGGIEFPGYVGLQVMKKSHRLNKPVEVKFNYGQDYSDYYDLSTLMGHELEVYITNIPNDEEHTKSLFLTKWEGSDFVDGSNFCECGGLQYIFLKNHYNNGFDVDIDFSDVEYKYGKLVIMLTETTLHEINIDGNTETETYQMERQSILYFKIDNGRVAFKRTQFDMEGEDHVVEVEIS